MRLLELLAKAKPDALASMQRNNMPVRPPPPELRHPRESQQQAQLTAPEDNFMARVSRGEEQPFDVGGTVKVGGKALDATSRFRAKATQKVADFLGEAQESVMGRGGAPFEISKDMKLALKTEDLLGFDGPREAAAAILESPDWRSRFDVQSDLTASIIEKWRKQQLTTQPGLADQATKNLEALRPKPEFGIGADEFASMADSPQLGARLSELLGGTGENPSIIRPFRH